MSVIHLAGIKIKIGSRCIQRCIVCGEALVNDDLSCMASSDGPVKPSFFETGALIEVENNDGCRRSSVVGELPEDFKPEFLPKDFCLELVEH